MESAFDYGLAGAVGAGVGFGVGGVVGGVLTFTGVDPACICVAAEFGVEKFITVKDVAKNALKAGGIGAVATGLVSMGALFGLKKAAERSLFGKSDCSK